MSVCLVDVRKAWARVRVSVGEALRRRSTCPQGQTRAVHDVGGMRKTCERLPAWDVWPR